MARKSTSELHNEYLRGLMQKAGTYSPKYEAQLADAADTYEMIQQLKKKVGKDVVVKEVKDKGAGVSVKAHPLLDVIVKLKNTYLNQLKALGLNMSPQEAGRQKGNGLAEFLGGRQER